jgi:acetyltransferase-like isoleucine patch superfamily enzyme
MDIRMRRVLALCMILLPMGLKRYLGQRLLGWEIHPTARIGFSIINVPRLTMGPLASIGSLNVIKGLEELRLDEGASIGTRNSVTGFPLSSPEFNEVFKRSPNRYPALILGKHASISVVHDIDCSDRVELAEYASLDGFRSTVMTHNLNLVQDKFEAAPVEIGHHSVVMSGCTLLSGTRIPERCVISAGSIITTKLTNELTRYGGNPAEAIGSLPGTWRFFHRGEAGSAAR